METIRAAILGVIQGLTEFLPVSSSGHLELAKYFLGDTSAGEESLLMTIVLHAATALSTMVVFRKDIGEILRGLFQFRNNEAWQFSLKIVISMIPAALIGLFFEDYIEQLFAQQIPLVAAMLIVTGLLLFLADRARMTEKVVSYPHALLIGIAQAIAILPGISRSGATISTSVLLGIDRNRAARFSFLMVVPLILGKIAKDVFDGDFADSPQVAALGIGFTAAFFTGLVACTLMIKLVQKGELRYFAVYCFAVATIAMMAWTW